MEGCIMADAIKVQELILMKDGTYSVMHKETTAEMVLLSDGTTVEQNLAGVVQLLESVVGKP